MLLRKSPSGKSVGIFIVFSVVDYGSPIGPDNVYPQSAFDLCLAAIPESGGTLEIPNGIIIQNDTLLGPEINRDNITIMGGGTIRRATEDQEGNPLINSRLFTGVCNNVSFENINFDVNGIEQYGGAQIDLSSNVDFIDCNWVDTNTTGPNGFDHYALVAQRSTNIRIQNCRAQYCKFELNANNGCYVYDTIVDKPLGSQGICAVAIDSGTQNFKNYYWDNCEVIDAYGDAFAIAVESTVTGDKLFQNFNITNCTARYTGEVTAVESGFYQGTEGTLATLTFKEIFTDNNRVIYESDTVVPSKSAFRAVNQLTSQAFTNSSFCYNVVIGYTEATEFVYSCQFFLNSDIKNNISRPDGIGSKATLGFFLHDLTSCNIENNFVDCESAATAYDFDNSGGGNIFQNNKQSGCLTPFSGYQIAAAASDQVEALVAWQTTNISAQAINANSYANVIVPFTGIDITTKDLVEGNPISGSLENGVNWSLNANNTNNIRLTLTNLQGVNINTNARDWIFKVTRYFGGTANGPV